MAMLPVAARWQPPDTGQSTAAAPVAATSEPRRRTSASSVVLISAHTLPGPSPASTPSVPSSTAALAAGLGRHVITTSQVSAMTRGLSPHAAPASRNG